MTTFIVFRIKTVLIQNQSITSSSFISETTLSFYTHQIIFFVFGALEEKCATKTTMLRTGSAFQIIRQKCLLLQLWFLDKLLFLWEISILSNNTQYWSANSFRDTESDSIWRKTLGADEPHLVERPVVIMCESWQCRCYFLFFCLCCVLIRYL